MGLQWRQHVYDRRVAPDALARLTRVLPMTFIRRYGLRETVRELRSSVMVALAGRGFRARGTPSLHELERVASALHVSGADALIGFLGRDSDVDAWRAEYAQVRRALDARYEACAGRLPFPLTHALGEDSSLLLYGLVRALRPAVIVETGVANGQSTFVMLHALARNQHGVCHSIDVSPDSGVLLGERERRQWRFHTLDPHDSCGSFEAILASLPPVDLFFHDSEHSYRWQTYEYRAAARHLAPSGVLATDDADCSYAFVDFARQAGVKPVLLIDRVKVFGFLPPASLPAIR